MSDQPKHKLWLPTCINMYSVFPNLKEMLSTPKNDQVYGDEETQIGVEHYIKSEYTRVSPISDTSSSSNVIPLYRR